MSHADFRDVDLYRAVFKEANLYTTNFRGRISLVPTFKVPGCTA